ncbi:phosphoglycerate mutase [Bdellovibrio bacteriovorus]|uniref:Phosphoglycerate mutase n=1 Tax=Bdellovibrio bacteriovorus TaxID=959 RepID=A0A150WFD4_BDEBC|nr:phosphoglycerate mutase family protein [Bdellovibrio bacteriovorus]KYG61680.1 phosphoglycerate mutase [Bdellovibrio bacteriovorus]
MKLYLFRHAQKAMDFSGDPDLTAEGHAQASKLLDKVIKNEMAVPTELWVSPKKRTQSTFRPLSKHYGLELQGQEALYEQQSDENLAQFRMRINRLLETMTDKKSDAVIYACTHYDWVVEAMAVIPSDKDLHTSEFSHWGPCQYIHFNVTAEGLFEFVEFKRISL